MTRFPARQNFLIMESCCRFCDSSGAANHFAAGGNAPRRRGSWTENITGCLILVVARERSLQ